MQHKLKNFMCLLLLILLSGCMEVGPDYVRPEFAMPARYKEAPKGWKFAEPRDWAARGEWWKIFKDPVLNTLLQKVNVSNQNIAVAVAQYKEALATVMQTSAAFWPTVTVDASPGRQKSAESLNGIITRANIYDVYQGQVAATWSPDLFGVVRRAVEAAEAGAQASAAQLEDTKLSMQAMLAQTYFQLRAADLNQKFLNDNVIAYRNALQLTKNQYASGIVSRLNITQAESQLQTAETAALDNGIARAQYEHAIAVLMGITPEELHIAPQQLALTIPQIPLEIPATLLERRADVAAAERTIAQANANIGVAIAAYFPTLSITPNYGYSSNRFREIFTYPSLMWSIAATLTETIFNGGLRYAQLQNARAVYEQDLATYRQTVLAALQNVEDNLVAVRILDSEVKVQDAAVSSADLALELTMNQYKAGIVAYSSVILAQNTAYTAKSTAIAIYSRRLVATVDLIQALGGGWNVADIDTAATSPCENIAAEILHKF